MLLFVYSLYIQIAAPPFSPPSPTLKSSSLHCPLLFSSEKGSPPWVPLHPGASSPSRSDTSSPTEVQPGSQSKGGCQGSYVREWRPRQPFFYVFREPHERQAAHLLQMYRASRSSSCVLPDCGPSSLTPQGPRIVDSVGLVVALTILTWSSFSNVNKQNVPLSCSTLKMSAVFCVCFQALSGTQSLSTGLLYQGLLW